jgi:hypothetical protein
MKPEPQVRPKPNLKAEGGRRVLSFRFVSFKHPDSPLGLISPSGDPATRLSLRSSLFGRGGDLSPALPTVSVDRRGDLSPAWRPPVHSARFRFPPSSFKLHP